MITDAYPKKNVFSISFFAEKLMKNFFQKSTQVG